MKALFTCYALVAGGPVALADEAAASNACNHLVNATNTQYRLSIPAEHKTATVQVIPGAPSSGFSDFTLEGSYRAGGDVGQVVLPMALRAAFATNANGSVLLELTVCDRKATHSWRFSSTGEAESLYALRLLAPDQKWAQQMANRIGTNDMVSQPPPRERDGILAADIINLAADTGREALKCATESFNNHRAEILSRFGRGFLYYPPAEQLRWSIRRHGEKLYAVSGCYDRMWAAAFMIQLKEKDDQHWAAIRIYADAWFKGE